MLSWQKFLERKDCDIKADGNLEDMEEKLGKDLDDDEEENEPLAHKKKVFGKKPKEEEESQ